jgi:hypothetical protein
MPRERRRGNPRRAAGPGSETTALNESGSRAARYGFCYEQRCGLAAWARWRGETRSAERPARAGKAVWKASRFAPTRCSGLRLASPAGSRQATHCADIRKVGRLMRCPCAWCACGVELPSSTLYDWFARAGHEAELLAPFVHELLLGSDLISLDDTPLPAKKRDQANGIERGRLWLYIGVELREPVVPMPREKHKWKNPRGESTDAEHWGGSTRLSVEGW